MSDFESVRAILHSKYIDPSNVKPYTGLHINTNGTIEKREKRFIDLIVLGDMILSTPSLESYRVNKDPLYRYDGSMSARLPKEMDHRILSYDSLENRRYRSLRMKQPIPWNVTRVFQERCNKSSCSIEILNSPFVLVGGVVSPRAEPSKTIRIQTAPGYRLLLNQIPNQDQTMVPQRFNKLSPFVTEYGSNPNTNPVLRQFLA